MLLALTCKGVYKAVLDYQYSRLIELRGTPYVILDLPCFLRGCSGHCNLLYVHFSRRVQCCDCLYSARIKPNMVVAVQKTIDFSIAGHHHSLWKQPQ